MRLCETLTFFSEITMNSLEFSVHVFNRLSLIWEHFEKIIRH